MFEPDPDCVVCVCHDVSEAEIVAVIRTGAGSPQAVGDGCLAGTGCGSCVEALHELIEDFG
ncbi:(2Fe-2S)-binding protein [Streptomyces sp. NBC_01298]|uniref:(2Fe-2S)-binding protein n=1 Tax=Streptomyces sp. NBC_01298 TaxID=2903817 RepID=UPI002E14E0EF|nr:(2Fe-2S)-binding protein [Streptomyces sp. NBC_01298]